MSKQYTGLMALNDEDKENSPKSSNTGKLLIVSLDLL